MGWGDELIVTGQARVMQETDPRRVRIVYEKGRGHEAWAHNPRLAQPNEAGDFQMLRPRDGYLRPYMTAKGDGRWTWRAWGPPKGELYFDETERQFGADRAGRIIVEPNLKPGASPNKQWGWLRWNKLAWLMSREGVRLTQLGPSGTPLLERVELLPTKSMRLAAAVIANARAAVLPEGGLHHVAAAVGTKAVVIYGGYIAPAVTGYADQVNVFHADERWPLGCGSRQPCEHCKAAMAAIEPEQVASHLMGVLNDVSTPRHLAA